MYRKWRWVGPKRTPDVTGTHSTHTFPYSEKDCVMVGAPWCGMPLGNPREVVAVGTNYHS